MRSTSARSARVLQPRTSSGSGDFGVDALTALIEQGDAVGEIELLVRVVRLKRFEAGPQRGEGEGVDAGVDLADRALLLAGRFFLDDGSDAFDQLLAGAITNDAAVTSGIFEHGGEQRGGCGTRFVPAGERGERFRADQRGVAGNDQRVLRAGFHQRIASDLHGVARAALRHLHDGLCAERLDNRAHGLCLMPDDDEDGTRSQRRAGADDVLDKRAAAGTMQHLGELRAQARALARGQDDDGEVARRHRNPILAL